MLLLEAEAVAYSAPCGRAQPVHVDKFVRQIAQLYFLPEFTVSTHTHTHKEKVRERERKIGPEVPKYSGEDLHVVCAVRIDPPRLLEQRSSLDRCQCLQRCALIAALWVSSVPAGSRPSGSRPWPPGRESSRWSTALSPAAQTIPLPRGTRTCGASPHIHAIACAETQIHHMRAHKCAGAPPTHNANNATYRHRQRYALPSMRSSSRTACVPVCAQ